MRKLPSLEYLEECFSLDSTCPSGLRWKERPVSHFKIEGSQRGFNKQFAGKPAGGMGKGYFVLEILGKLFYCHRIVFALFNRNTDIQQYQIDHINRNKLDNSPTNLRLSDNSLNQMNTSRPKQTSSGVRNVVWDKRIGMWDLVFQLYGVRYRVGRFYKLEDAIDMRESFVLSNNDRFPFLLSG